MRPLHHVTAAVVLAAALTTYASIAGGGLSGATLFLGVAGSTLVWALVLLAGAARALFADPPAVETAVATGRRRKELEREKAALLKAIKELEFDHEMGKVSDADHAEIGGVYRARAIRVLRQLDDREVDYARLVEEELAREKKARGISAPRPAADPIPSSAEVGRCTGCGTRNDADAVFCKKCATRLIAEEKSA